MPSQVSKKNSWLSKGAGNKFAATTYGTSTIPEEDIPDNALAKKKKNLKADKFRALDTFGMW